MFQHRALWTTCSATPASTMSARATFNSPTDNGSAENLATRSRRWARQSSLRMNCLILNGATMQDSNTDQLIFGVPELIEFLARTITLEPGDVIATGTPSGVGFARKPSVYLKPCDEMIVDIEGIGKLNNPVVAAAERVGTAA